MCPVPCRWCALPDGNGEPERISDLSALPMLAKVTVKPEMVNLIAVIHNGDLEHIMAMEVADAVRDPQATSSCTDVV